MHQLRRYKYVTLEEEHETSQALGPVEERQLDGKRSTTQTVGNMSRMYGLFAYRTMQTLHVLYVC